MGALSATLSFRFRAGRNKSILTWDGNEEMGCNRTAEIYMKKSANTASVPPVQPFNILGSRWKVRGLFKCP